jgi:hypothetical protein
MWAGGDINAIGFETTTLYASASLFRIKLYAHTPSFSDGELNASSLRICHYEFAIGGPCRVNASAIDARKNDNSVAEGSSVHYRVREFYDCSGGGHRPAISGENRSLDYTCRGQQTVRLNTDNRSV